MRLAGIFFAALVISISAKANEVSSRIFPVVFPIVVDANSKVVGGLAGLMVNPSTDAITPLVTLRVNSQTVVLLATPEGLESIPPFYASNTFYWESSECTERPYFAGSLIGGDALSPAPFILNGNLYVGEGQIREYTVAGVGLGEGDCVSVEPFLAETVPLKFLADLRGRFRPPFSVK